MVSGGQVSFQSIHSEPQNGLHPFGYAGATQVKVPENDCNQGRFPDGYH